jgi:hypothetical protein
MLWRHVRIFDAKTCCRQRDQSAEKLEVSSLFCSKHYRSSVGSIKFRRGVAEVSPGKSEAAVGRGVLDSNQSEKAASAEVG